MENSDQSKNTTFKSLRDECQSLLRMRMYGDEASNAVGLEGIEARYLIDSDASACNWIPGVEIFARDVKQQRYRGHFGELVRKEEGICKKIGIWPSQWSASTMFAGTSKGFHIHPPYVPQNEESSIWFQKLYKSDSPDYTLRPYDKEQWDLMFFLTGSIEMFLVDEREGLERNIMRVFIDGDDFQSPNNAGIVIPPGVAHAIRCDASRPATLVYGTTTVFDPKHEGRLADEIERMNLPEAWSNYLNLC